MSAISEPGAGSWTLPSLQTRCVDAGDYWVINGQKVWTSGAQWSDWCGCLVRTDPTAKKHEGISFILLNMRQPGVETRLIKLISGDSPFCETFLTDAKADKDALLGELNHGWTVGKRLLQHERASQTGVRMSGAKPTPLDEIAKRYVGVDDAGRLADSELRVRLTEHLMHTRAHGLTIARAAAEAKGNAGPGNAASVLKNSAAVDRPDPGRADAGDHGSQRPRLGGRRLHLGRNPDRAGLARRQGDVDLRRLVRDPEQHHLQADPRPA